MKFYVTKKKKSDEIRLFYITENDGAFHCFSMQVGVIALKSNSRLLHF